MKYKPVAATALLSASIFFSACGEKEKKSEVNDQQTSAESSEQTEELPEKSGIVDTSKSSDPLTKNPPPAGSGDLAAKLGVASILPRSTEGLLSISQLDDSIERLFNTKIGQFILEAAKDAGTDIRAEFNAPEAQMVRNVIGEEIFISFGAGASEQLSHLLELAKASNYNSGKDIVMLVDALLQGREPDFGVPGMNSPDVAMFASFIKNGDKAVSIFEQAQMPPIVLGFKASNAENRNGMAALIKGQLENGLREDKAPLEKFETEKDGVQFTGVTILGKKLSAQITEQNRKKLAKVLQSKELAERFVQAVGQKNLVVATGVKDDYVLILLANSPDQIQLANSPANSLLQHPELSFAKPYATKDIRFLIFSPKVAYHAAEKNPEAFASMFRGVKDGLAESETLKDTRDVKRLLEHATKLDQEIWSLQKYTGGGAIGFREKGFRIESHGGSNLPGIDSKVAHQFASLSSNPDVLFFANSVEDKVFAEKFREIISTVGEAAYLMTRHIAQLEVDERDFREFKQGFTMVDSMFSEDLVQIWKALCEDLGEGLGEESAFVIDLKGSMPTVPVIPSVIVKEGKIPRLAYISNVKDRTKVGQSWTRLNGTISGILKKAEKLGMPPVPMPEPFKSSSNNVENHYFNIIPFTTPNAMPCVGLNDELFFISTSLEFNGEIAQAVKAGGLERKGAYVEFDFQALNRLARHWLDLVKNNQDEIFGENEFQKGDFAEGVPMIEKALEAFSELKDVSWHLRREGGESRGTFHFHMN